MEYGDVLSLILSSCISAFGALSNGKRKMKLLKGTIYYFLFGILFAISFAVVVVFSPLLLFCSLFFTIFILLGLVYELSGNFFVNRSISKDGR